jgi:DNA-binding NarL/FixJ family response regulator
MPGVLIIGGDRATREALRKLFHETGRLEVCGETESNALALEKAKSLSPRLIVVDAADALPKSFVQQLREAAPSTDIFMLAAKYGLAVEKAALACGVTAVFSRTDDLETLIANALAVTQDQEKIHGEPLEEDTEQPQKSATARHGS